MGDNVIQAAVTVCWHQALFRPAIVLEEIENVKGCFIALWHSVKPLKIVFKE